MKKSIVSKISGNHCILFSLLFLSVVACNTGLKKSRTDTTQLPNHDKHQTISDDQTFAPNELIVWKNPKRKQKEFEEWLNILKKNNRGEIIEKNNCGSCDSSLKLLTGPGIETLIQGGLANGVVKSDPKPPSTGDEDTAYFCLNYRIRHKRPRINPINTIENSATGTNIKKVVKVAVFDTGIDPVQLSKYSYNSFGRSCIKGASAGYNFINPGFSFIDDDPKKHGTIVTHLITEQVNKYRNNKVEILSVKTHDANGIGDLYRILCAFAYAQQMGVQIINASFGFYSPQRKLVEEADPAAFKNALLLRNYIKHYLTRNSILLITAAGNEDDENEKKAFDDSGLQDFYPKNHRDLDEVAFLPASFARSPELPNVIAVTTVHINKRGKGTVSPDQNFSEHVVDIGVKADALTDDNNYGFQTPVLANGEVAVGSSFAAPIVTGILCAHYDKIITLISKGNFKKDDLWKILEPQIVRREPSLKDKINEGRVMERLR